MFQDLGDLRVVVHGRRRTPGGARPSALLAALLVHADRRVPVDVLTAAVWPDGPPRSTSTLESHLWRLRGVLEPDRAPGEPSRLLRTEPGGYRLAVDEDQVDSRRFARLVREAGDALARGSPDTAGHRCEQARTLWRGRPFGQVADQPWAAPAVARLEELRSQLLEHHIGALLELGRAEAALVELGGALGEHPLRERLWSQQMVASYRAGRVDDALAAYARVRALLRDELGADPGEELRETHRRVLTGDPTLRRPAAPSEPLPPAGDPLPTLPRWATRTIGREHELERLGTLLREARLVTVWGPAGVGKTRLAVEAARRAAASFPGGVYFVDLTGAGGGDQVVDAVAAAVGLSASPSVSQVEALRTFLRERRVLLLLDDGEHVVDEVAALAEGLLPAAPALGLLVTSRERLELDGETVVALVPLAVPGDHRPGGPALELFLDRWEAHAGPIAVDDHDHARRVCRAVEGVPLALELAAARARTFSLSEVADQTEEDPSTLSGFGRRRHGRRASVFATVERTHHLLDDDERRLHRALATLPGSFTVRAAAALAGRDGAAAADLLADLAHRSLLVSRGPRETGRPTGFAQLTIVRAHAARALDAADESTAVRERRDAWVLRSVTADRPRLGTAREKDWSDALADDLAALRATLQRRLVDEPAPLGVAVVAGLGTMFWYQHDATVEGRRWIELASEVARTEGGAVPAADATRVAIALATVRAFARRPDIAGPVCDRVLADLGAVPAALDDPLVGDALAVLSTCLGLAGDVDRARRVLDLVAVAVERSGDPTLDLLHRVRAAMAGLGVEAPHTTLARTAALHEEAREADNRFAAWIASGTAHLAALAVGDGEAALGWSDACLVAIDRSGRRHAPFQLELRADTLALLARHEEAGPLYDVARVHVERAGLPWPSMPGTAELLARTRSAVPEAEPARVGEDVVRSTVRDLLRP